MKKDFAIIGLGRFGSSVCEELINLGMEVMVIDKNEERVDEFSDIATHAVIADSTDEDVLRSLGMRNFDHVIVSIGDDIRASILTTLILKEMNVKSVTAKAKDLYHGKVLEKIGADEVIYPERDMGIRIANNLASPRVLDYIDLSETHGLVEIVANKKISGQSLIDLDIRAKHDITIVAILRNNEIIAPPQADEIIQEEDHLVIVGSYEKMDEFEEWLD